MAQKGFRKAFAGFFAKSEMAKGRKAAFPYFYQTYIEGIGSPVWSARNYERFAEEAYSRNVVAFRAISLIAEAASSIELRLIELTASGKKVIQVHPLISLLKRPNPNCSGTDFMESLYSYRLISGNAYVLSLAGSGAAPVELYSLRPDRVTIIPGKNCMPAAYRYQVGESYTDYKVDRISGKSQVMHFKTFNPLDDWYGLSPVEAAAYSIDQHNQASAWNQALLQNSARPSGALVVKSDGSYGGVLSQEQYTRLKNQIDEQFSGHSNAGRPILLEGGLDWKEMSLSPKDMDFLNNKYSSAREIALAFGMPPQMLGIPGDNTYSNYAEARLSFWEETVIPLADSLVKALNGWLVPRFGKNLELELNLEHLSALAPRRDALWQRVSQADFLTDQKKRELLGV